MANDGIPAPAGSPSSYIPFSADGHVVRWAPWAADAEQGAADEAETLTLAWENEAWTASGVGGGEHIHYVLRISPSWHVRQFLLFRDLEDPDLWLGTDGHGRWGEMNGAHRPELDGCVDLYLACTPFTSTLPMRRLPLHVGHTADITVASVDVETLDIQPDHHRYTRIDSHRWRFERLSTGEASEFDVDQYGLVLDQRQRFRRIT